MSSDDGPDVEVRRLEQDDAYVAEIDGVVVANLTYAQRDGRIVLIDTIVLPSMRGRGIAGTLIAGALDDIRVRGERIVVECPAVASFLSRHPEYADLAA